MDGHMVLSKLFLLKGAASGRALFQPLSFPDPQIMLAGAQGGEGTGREGVIRAGVRTQESPTASRVLRALERVTGGDGCQLEVGSDRLPFPEACGQGSPAKEAGRTGTLPPSASIALLEWGEREK